MKKEMPALKNGLFYENDELIYYRGGFPKHAGVVRIDEDIYYISSGGKAVKGPHLVHKEMTNGILKPGVYVFGEDCKLVPDSYRPTKETMRGKGGSSRKKGKPGVFSEIWRYIKKIARKKETLATILSVVLLMGLIWFASMNERGAFRRKPNSTGNSTGVTASQGADIWKEITSNAEKETAGDTEKETVSDTEKETVSDTAKDTASDTVKETVGTAAEETTGDTTKETEAAKGPARITLPQYTEDVLLCSEVAKMEYDGEISIKTAVEAGDPYTPFVFEYSFKNCSGTLWLGEKADFSDAVSYDLPESKRSIEIHNLKVDTDYYYKVAVAGQEYLGNFHTALSTRYIYIPGLENVRDIGGGTTLDGKRVKQDMLIRGVEPDGLATIELFIPDDKIEEVKQTYNFAYDMDLRAKRVYLGEYTSRLGIPHKFYYAPQYGEVFNTGFRSALKQVFADLANPENYPIYMHCTWGRDRTGTIIYLLQGVLNMSQEDMVQEYLRSAYWFKKMATSEDLRVIDAGLEPYAGDTLQEKIVNFLITEIGVTEEEIASIRSILLEKGK